MLSCKKINESYFYIQRWRFYLKWNWIRPPIPPLALCRNWKSAIYFAWKPKITGKKWDLTFSSLFMYIHSFAPLNYSYFLCKHIGLSSVECHTSVNRCKTGNNAVFGSILIRKKTWFFEKDQFLKKEQISVSVSSIQTGFAARWAERLRSRRQKPLLGSLTSMKKMD